MGADKKNNKIKQVHIQTKQRDRAVGREGSKKTEREVAGFLKTALPKTKRAEEEDAGSGGWVKV